MLPMALALLLAACTKRGKKGQEKTYPGDTEARRAQRTPINAHLKKTAIHPRCSVVAPVPLVLP
jgi:hypothetical protein